MQTTIIRSGVKFLLRRISRGLCAVKGWFAYLGGVKIAHAKRKAELVERVNRGDFDEFIPLVPKHKMLWRAMA